MARVSRRKAEATPREPDDVVVAADTIVVCQGRVLGKPREEAEARAMLRLLSGRGSYHETHNALFDAMDELEIMRLLGLAPCEYIKL